MRRVAVYLALISSLAGTARADWIVLKNGRTFAGEIVDIGDELWIHRADGTSALIVASEVARRRTAESLHEDFEGLQADLAKRELSASDRLGESDHLLAWCLEYGLEEEARLVARQVLALDVGHARAREILARASLAEADAIVPARRVRASFLHDPETARTLPAGPEPSWRSAQEDIGGENLPDRADMRRGAGNARRGGGMYGRSTVLDLRLAAAQLLGFVPFNTPLAVSAGQTLTVTISWPNITLQAYHGSVAAPSR
ncbi:MAG: hypothetical protein HY608_04265 [Planctomycetes bacterium]|nr:hypothetical protein [Planctomycetota bacterium]